MKFRGILRLMFVVVTGILIYLPLFLHLDVWSYRAYDEATTGINAYSIYQSGDYLIPTNEGQPEMWNCKPPFLMWCQVFFMKLIGVGELSLRLPVSLSIVALSLFLMFALYKLSDSVMPGWIATMVLVTTPGFVSNHVARTGDFDGMLTVFTTFYCLLFYFYTEASCTKTGRTLLFFFFLFLLLATFTKGIASVLFLPVILFYAVFRKKLYVLVSDKFFWMLSVSYVLLVVSYYIYRDYRVPGFLQAMLDNEVFSRYKGTVGSQTGPWYYYINRCYEALYDYWLWFLPIPVFIMSSSASKFKRFYLYILALVVFHHVAIAYTATKLDWYIAPEYPLLAILIGLGLYEIWHYHILPQNSQLKTAGILIVLTLAVFAHPYSKIVESVYFPSDLHTYPNEYPNFGKFIREKVSESKTTLFYVLCGYKFTPDIKLQVYSLQNRGFQVRLLDNNQNDFSNKAIVAEAGEFYGRIGPDYHYQILDADTNSIYCKVFEKKAK